MTCVVIGRVLVGTTVVWIGKVEWSVGRGCTTASFSVKEFHFDFAVRHYMQ